LQRGATGPDLLGARNRAALVYKTSLGVSLNPTVRRLPGKTMMDPGNREETIHTLAMTTRSAKLFDTCCATPMGLVSQLLLGRSDPSGIVTVISSRTCAVEKMINGEWGAADMDTHL